MAHFRWIFPAFLILLLTSCSPSGPAAATRSALGHPEVPTPTPTYSPPLVGKETETLEPTRGVVEIIIPFEIFSQSEGPSSTVPDCVTMIPFSIIQDGLRKLSQGEGNIDCHFEDTPGDSPITFHVVMNYEAVFNGELLPATIDRPSGWLDAYLTLNGELVQYYVGYPSEASNPCPESNPCPIPIAEIIPLPFTLEDGDTVSIPWTFILHLH